MQEPYILRDAMQEIYPFINNCPLHPAEGRCIGLQKKIDESAKKIVSLKKSFAEMKKNTKKKVDLSYLNTEKDPEYMAACERGWQDKLLEKRWDKYNWFEKFFLVVVGIIFLKTFRLKNYHPVLMEDHWSFYFFKKP